jgi:hypothetical protein
MILLRFGLPPGFTPHLIQRAILREAFPNLLVPGSAFWLGGIALSFLAKKNPLSEGLDNGF